MAAKKQWYIVFPAPPNKRGGFTDLGGDRVEPESRWAPGPGETEDEKHNEMLTVSKRPGIAFSREVEEGWTIEKVNGIEKRVRDTTTKTRILPVTKAD